MKTCVAPKRLKTIGPGAFYGCSSLTSFIIPDSVTTIGASAFSGTGLTSIVIPKFVNFIGDNAFSCNKLNEIYCLSETPPTISRRTFSYVDYTICKLYVPGTSYGLYSFSLGWDFFRSNMIAPIPQTNTSEVKFYLINNTLILKGLHFGEIISIYSLTGALIHRTNVTDDIIRIIVPTNQIYIVKTANKTYKLVI